MKYRVFLPNDTVYEEILDRESPWGSSVRFRRDIFDWIDARIPDDEWDFNSHFSGSGVDVMFNNQDVALLFKLTWGGK